MLIVGLGSAGCNIAELFKKQNKYEVVQLDEDKGIKKQKSVELYDTIDYKPRKKAIKSATEGILFLCGSGKVAGATLRVLEGLKHVNMTVVYIYPDLEFASEVERRRNKVHFNVLQEYARSGLINELLLLDNKTIMDLAPSGTVYDFYKNVNYFIYSTIHTLNYCANVKPEFSSTHDPKEISRISTIGYAKFEEGEEKLYFPLDNITETCYIININEEELANDVSIMPNVKGMVRDNKKLNRDTSFSIWSTTEDNNYYYAKHYTHFVQEKT
jgi:hypothetical protein